MCPMRQKEAINTSLFYMWRAVVTIAHADGIVHEAEKAYLGKIFANLDRMYILTAEQKSTLQNDLSKPQSLADMLRHINDPAARANVIYFGGLLARADGVLHPSEDAILKKLHADQMASLDMEQIRKTYARPLPMKPSAMTSPYRISAPKAAFRPCWTLSCCVLASI